MTHTTTTGRALRDQGRPLPFIAVLNPDQRSRLGTIWERDGRSVAVCTACQAEVCDQPDDDRALTLLLAHVRIHHPAGAAA